MSIELLPATPADCEALLQLMADFNRHEGIRFERGYLTPALTRLLADPSLGRIWWVVGDEVRLGYTVLTFSYSLEYGGRNALLDELYLLPENRGKGFGGEVLDLLERECERLGIGVIYLEASQKNPHAQALYRRRGFIDQNRILLSKRLPWDLLA